MILIQMDCFKNQCFCDNNFDDCGSPTGYVRYIFLNPMFKWNILDEKPFYYFSKTDPTLAGGTSYSKQPSDECKERMFLFLQNSEK